MRFEKISENKSEQNKPEEDGENRAYDDPNEMIKENIERLSDFHPEKSDKERRIQESLASIPDDDTNSGSIISQMNKENYVPAKPKDKDHVSEVQ